MNHCDTADAAGITAADEKDNDDEEDENEDEDDDEDDDEEVKFFCFLQ